MVCMMMKSLLDMTIHDLNKIGRDKHVTHQSQQRMSSKMGSAKPLTHAGLEKEMGHGILQPSCHSVRLGTVIWVEHRALTHHRIQT